MNSWYTAADLAGLPGLPSTDRRVRDRAERESWPARKRAKGKGLEYPFSALPPEAKTALLLRAAPKPEARERAAKGQATAQVVAAAWERFESATEKRRAKAHAAAAALDAVRALVAGGMPKTRAQSMVMAQHGCSSSALYRWERDTQGAARPDWPALLLDGYVGRTQEAAFDEAARDFYRGMYMSRDEQTHAECYRRLREVAKVNGWHVPSAKTVQRWLDDTYDLQMQTAARNGSVLAMRMTPASRRDETVYLAGQCVNGDGLKFDELWVQFPDGEAINTATGWFYQDTRTRKMLAYRLGKTENTDLFRLATYDLTAICAPEVMVLDNTRVAANLLMTGGAEHRNRFRRKGVQGSHGTGLLSMLGIDTRFTNPDPEVNNPGSKPIERAFGIGGLHSKVATNPEVRTYGGYSKATAVPFEVFKRAVAVEVARHNAQEGRRSRAAGGVLSLDQAWEQAPKYPRVLSDSQRRLLLMCRELVTVSRSVMQVAIKAGRNAHGDNRYTADGIARYAGKQVYVHYDPEALHAGAYLYDLQGRYLMALEHIATHAFHSKSAGDEVAKFRHRKKKALQKVVVESQRMDAIERAQLYGKATEELVVASAEVAPKASETVVQGHFQRMPDPTRDAATTVMGDGTVVDIRTGEILKRADGGLTDQEIAEHDWLRRAAEAQRKARW